jgi:hypothetical protein
MTICEYDRVTDSTLIESVRRSSVETGRSTAPIERFKRSSVIFGRPTALIDNVRRSSFEVVRSTALSSAVKATLDVFFCISASEVVLFTSQVIDISIVKAWLRIPRFHMPIRDDRDRDRSRLDNTLNNPLDWSLDDPVSSAKSFRVAIVFSSLVCSCDGIKNWSSRNKSWNIGHVRSWYPAIGICTMEMQLW